MTIVIGMDEVLSLERVLDETGSALRRAIQTFSDKVTLTFGAAVVATAIGATQVPVPQTGPVSFTEPAPSSIVETQLGRSIGSFQAFLNDMRTGVPSSLTHELEPLACEAIASVNLRQHQDVAMWAHALASDVADLDD